MIHTLITTFIALIFLTISAILTSCSSGMPISIGGNFGGFKLSSDEFAGGAQAIGKLWESTRTFEPRDEYLLGRGVAANILGKYPPLQDQQLNDYVSKVGYVLAMQSESPETFAGYRFQVVDTPVVNALAAPGGFIFVTRGLLEQLENEEMLAGVLAHEIAHVVKEHGVDAIQSSKATSGIMQGIGIAAGRVGGKRRQSAGSALISANLGGSVGKVVETLFEKGYSRSQELEADEYALTLLSRAGYQHDGLFQVLKRLEDLSEDQSGGLFDTHPRFDDRIELVREKGSLGDTRQVPARQARFARAKMGLQMESAA